LAFLALGKKGDFARLFFPKSRKPVSKGIKSIFRKLGKYGFLSLAPFGDGFVVKQVQILKTASGYYIILSGASRCENSPTTYKAVMPSDWIWY